MIYTKKSPALLIIGVVMLLWGWLNASGSIDGMQNWLQKSAYSDHMKVKEKYDAELRVATEMAAAEGKPAPEMKMPKSKFDDAKADQAKLSYIFGGIATLLGLLILAWKPKEGNLDYYLSIFPGMAFILLIAFIVRWGLDPIFANWGKAAQPTLGWDFAKIFNLNYVVLGIVIGIVIVNVFKHPGLGRQRRAHRALLPQDRRDPARHALQRGRTGAARRAVGGHDRHLRARLGRRRAAHGQAHGRRQLDDGGALRRHGRLRRLGHGGGLAGGQCQGGGDRLHHRHHPDLGRAAACSSSRPSATCSAWVRCSSAPGPAPASSTRRRSPARRWPSIRTASRR